MAIQVGARKMLRLTITVQEQDRAEPLIREEADCRDVFDVIHELENVTGPRFRAKLNSATLVSLARLTPPHE